MKITRENYELFFVDYIDNKLSRDNILELMAFLAENPDLEEELEMVKEMKLEPEMISFDAKADLKKTIVSTDKFNELCVGKIENNLSSAEEKKLAELIKQNPNHKKDFELFKQTILKPDLSVVFPDKTKLKRRISTPFSIFYKMAIPAAAAVALLIMFTYNNGLFNENINVKRNYIATKHENKNISNPIIQTNNITSKKEIAVVNHSKKQQKNNIVPNTYNNNVSTIAKIDTKTIVASNNINKTVIVNTNQLEKIIDNEIAINTSNNNINNEIATNTISDNNSTITNTDINTNTTINSDINNNANAVDIAYTEQEYSLKNELIKFIGNPSVESANSSFKRLLSHVVDRGTKEISNITDNKVNFESKIDKNNNTKLISFNIGPVGFSRITGY